jgi:predicted DNA-binding transcriptional regulator AlpA
MDIDSNASVIAGQERHAATVTISAWVNEPLPNIRDILCSRDLARLTRRSRWVLYGLALVGKFPRRKRYRGRIVGWCRTEVLDWMTRDLGIEAQAHQGGNAPHRFVDRRARQACLPLECSSSCVSTRQDDPAGRYDRP